MIIRLDKSDKLTHFLETRMKIDGFSWHQSTSGTCQSIELTI
jgi:hypothetical protein